MKANGESSLRKRILDTSRDLLVEVGYRQISMRKIARKVGVSATSIYLHFESKDHLLHTLMEEAIEDLNSTLEQSITGSEDPIEQLRAFARAYINYAMENPRQYQIIFLVRSEEMSRYPKEKFRRARRGYEMLEQTIAEGAQKGLLQEESPRTAAYVIWAELHGVMSVVQSRRLDVRIDREQFFESAIEKIIGGLKVPTATDSK